MKEFFKRINIFVLLFALASVLFVGGCGYYNVSFLIKNANLNDVTKIMKDYVGLSGYRFTYANDETGSYRIVIGRSLTPGTQSSDTFTQRDTISLGRDSKTVIEQSSTVQTSTPSQKLVAALAVQMSQQESDVFINAQSTGDIDAGDQFNAFIEYLKGKDYTIQKVQ